MSVALTPWIRAFLLTLAIEVPVVMIFLRSVPLRSRLWVAILANTLSHPLLWFCLTSLPIRDYTEWLLTAEIIVLGLEFLIYSAAFADTISIGRILAATVVANALSCALGLLISLR